MFFPFSIIHNSIDCTRVRIVIWLLRYWFGVPYGCFEWNVNEELNRQAKKTTNIIIMNVRRRIDATTQVAQIGNEVSEVFVIIIYC